MAPNEGMVVNYSLYIKTPFELNMKLSYPCVVHTKAGRI